MKIRYINESMFVPKHWTHGSQIPKYDYLLPVLDTLCSMKPLKLGNNGTDGVLTIENFTEEGRKEIEAVRDKLKEYVVDYKSGADLYNYNLPTDAAWLDQYLDINTELPDIITKKLSSKRQSTAVVWTSIYKQAFTGRDPSLEQKDKKSNKGLEFEDNYLAALYEEQEQVNLQEAINPGGTEMLYFPHAIDNKRKSSGRTTGFLGGPVKTGGECNKRPLTIAEDGFLYFFPSKYTENDIFNIGPTVTDITVPIYKNIDGASYSLEQKKDVVDPNADDYLYLSLKATGKHTFVNGGVRPIFPAEKIYEFGKREDIFNDKINISKIKFGDPINDKIVFDDPRANYLLNMFCINRIKFIDTFSNYDQRAVAKAKRAGTKITSPYVTEVFENLDDTRQEQLRHFVMSTIGYGYVLIDESGGKNKRIHYFDLREKESLPKFLAGHAADTIPDINRLIVSYPSYHQAKAISMTIEYPYVRLKYEFRSKDANIVCPTEILCDYEIKGIK